MWPCLLAIPRETFFEKVRCMMPNFAPISWRSWLSRLVHIPIQMIKISGSIIIWSHQRCMASTNSSPLHQRRNFYKIMSALLWRERCTLYMVFQLMVLQSVGRPLSCWIWVLAMEFEPSATTSRSWDHNFPAIQRKTNMRVGGFDEQDHMLHEAHVYNPMQNSWSKIASMGYKHFFPSNHMFWWIILLIVWNFMETN